MNTIIKYRAKHDLNKRQFCDRFKVREQHYNHHFSGNGQWAIIETETVDKLIEIKGEFLK